MADQDITEIGLDARGFEAGIQEVAEALKKYDIAITDAVDATAKFNRQGELLEATVTKIEQDGTKVVQTFGQIKNSIVSVTDGMGGLIKKFQDLDGNLTNLPTSFGLKSTKVTSAPDPNANAAAFEQAKIAGALRAQQIDDNLNKQRLSFEEKKLAAARRAAQEDDRISKERLAKQEAEAKLLEDIYNDKLKDYREYNKRIETEAKRALDERNKLEKKQNDEIIKNAIIRAKANADAQGKPSAINQATGSILNRASSILLSQAILEVNSAIQQSITDSVNFSKQLAAIGTISQNSSTSLDQFRAGIIEVSNAYGLARKDVADGTYETISNQVAEGSQAILFQAQAAKLAQATLASQADSVNALSSILNSYNKSVNETDQISASFFKTIDLGRLRLGDIANTIGTVTVAASQLGVSYQEVFAGIAELTRQGVSAANAQTFLRNLFNQLIKPTEAVREVLDKYGFATGQAAVQSLGFQGVLKLLSKEADGNIEKFGEFATNIRSLQALLGLAGDGGTKFDRSLKEITGSLGEFDKAAQIVAQSTGKQFERITTTISNEFLKIGDVISKAIVEITNTFGGINNVIEIAKAAFIGFATAVTVIAIPAIGALAVAFPAAATAAGTFGAALLATPLAGFAVTLGVIAAGIAVYQSEIEETFKRAKEIEDETNKLISRQNERKLKLVEEAQKAETQAVFKELAQINLKYSELEKTAIKTYQNIFEETNKFGSTLIASQNRIIRNLENENARSEKNLEVIRDRSASDQLKREQKIFEERIDGASLQLELTERTEQKARLLAQANEQVASGQNEAALKTLTLIDEQDVKILKLKDNVTKASKEYNNFLLDSVRNTFTQQEKIIDLTTNRMFKAFDNLKKALKDVNDSTGDRTGISGAFLKTFVKELDIATARSGASADRLRRNLDRLQSRGKAAILDQGTQDLLAQLDSSTVKELKYRIRIGDQESVARILDSIKEQQLLADENAKKQIANNQALFLDQTALSAAKRGDFETERKFLQEAAALRAKTTDDPVQSQQDFLTLNQRINDSFINQFTVKQKQTEEEASIFKQINAQIEAQGKINDTLVQRQAILEDIKVKEQEAVENRKKEIASQQENAVVLQKLFAQLGDIKINKNIKPSEALKEFNSISKEIDTIVAKLSTNPGDILKNEDLKLQLLNRLKKQEDALNKANALEEQKDRLAKIQQQVQIEKDLRIKLQQKLNDEELKLKQQNSELNVELGRAKTPTFGQFFESLAGDGVFDRIAAEIRALEQKQFLNDRELTTIQRIRDVIAEANKTGNGLKILDLDEKDQQKIRKIIDELSVANLTDEAKAALNLGTLFEDAQTRTQNLLNDTKKKLDEVKADAEKPIEINLDTTTFDKQVEAQFEQAQQLKDLYASITIGAGGDAVAGDVPTTQFFANGGLVGGKAGNDANLARLTKGEFVINARSTKNNLSDLIAINSGAKTTTRNNNVNLNGISINLNSSGDAKVDARQIGDELSRLVKQGVLRLS